MVDNTFEDAIKASLNNLATIAPNQFVSIAQGLQPWNSLDSKDLEVGLIEIKNLTSFLVDNNLLSEFPIFTLSQINTSLINIYNVYLQFVNSQAQGIIIKQNHFNNLLNHVDNFRSALRSYGIYNYVKLSPDIPKTKKSIDEQLSTIAEAQGRIRQLETDSMKRFESLENEIKGLISPAIAGSLSKSFGARKKFVFQMRIIFLVLTIITFGLGGWYTINIVNQIIPQISLENNSENNLSENNTDNLSISYNLLRVFALLPIYTVGVFLYRQYSRERTVEENYAHKETIATIIKTYGELISDQNAKDELLQNASKVIVSNPEKYIFEKQAKKVDNLDAQSLINKLFDLLKPKEL